MKQSSVEVALKSQKDANSLRPLIPERQGKIVEEKIPLRELQAGEVTSSGRALFHLGQDRASMKNNEVDKPGVEDNIVTDHGLEGRGCRYFWLQLSQVHGTG